MRFKYLAIIFIVIALSAGVIYKPVVVRASRSLPVPNPASAYEMILAMNTLRVSNGLPALIEDPIVMAVAQGTAEIMAANNMSWHIGDVKGRLATAGYGGGATVWATENFAVGTGGMGIDEIMAVWADPDHMRPAVTAAYCHVGAGMATTSDGRVYYVLQAAYISGKACGSASYTPNPSGSSGGYVSQVIIPVKIATPDAEGKIYHVVQAGQSFWSIAIAYQITINDIEYWNNLSRTVPLKTGQKLFIPDKNTVGYATPTPIGMIVPAAPDADGRIIHEIQAYQTLIAIAEAYQVTLDRVLALNGLQSDSILRVGQKLLIDPGHVTPSPTLSAIQKLTPESDGNYYHTVQSGQTLSWVAGYYNIPLLDLMNWNGLNNLSIIRVDQKLLLKVTPPITPTWTPEPPTATPTISPTATLATAVQTPVVTPEPEQASGAFNVGWLFLAFAGVIVAGGLFLWGISRKN